MFSALMNSSKILREENGHTVVTNQFYYRKSRNVNVDITMKELSKHNTKEDAWICIEGKAYSVTKYITCHPGGELPILNLAGKDATDVFANFHPASTYQKLLPFYYIGDIIDYNVSDFVREHRQLRQKLLLDGLFETRPSFYLGYGLWLIVLFFSALYMTFTFNMIGAVLLGFFWQQLAFFGHDIGHNAVSHQRQLDMKTGIIVGNTMGGISLAWWKYSHNVHHIVCNSIQHDPDNQHLPVFAPDKKYFGQFFSSFHQKYFTFNSLAKTFVSYQYLFFYPVMMVARLNLYVQGIIHLSTKKNQYQILEMSTICCFFIWFGILLTYLNSWQERVIYVAIAHGVAGILHIQVILSHFAEEVYHNKPYNDDTDEWFRLQLKTTLNIMCPEWMDFLHGGLQFQIEHHLFPRLPRHNLRQAQKLVKPFCKKHGIEYHELSFFHANIKLIQKLYQTSRDAHLSVLSHHGFYESKLWEGMNAIG